MRLKNQYPAKIGYLDKLPVNLHLQLVAVACLVSVLFYIEHAGIIQPQIPKFVFGVGSLNISLASSRILYLAPIIYAAYKLNLKNGFAFLALLLFFMLPETAISSNRIGSILATLVIALTGATILIWVNYHKKQQEHLKTASERLELAHKKLQSKVRISIHQENQLTTIANFSAMFAQTFELPQIFAAAADMTMQVMQAEIVMLFLLDKDKRELKLTAYKGINSKYASLMDRVTLGEGFCGIVAQTGRTLIIESMSADPKHGLPEVKEENLQSHLGVPLQAQNKVMGTLHVMTRSPRHFSDSEAELLAAIGNLIGIAIESTQLNYERELANAELRLSEKKYRQLFENAHDAIWVQDLSGTIIGANHAASSLFGWSLPELIGMDRSSLVSQEGLALFQEVQERLINGRDVKQPYTQNIIKKDGTEAILTITTNLISVNDHPYAFQFIGRDITKEVRMQENLRFYLQQITQAHEDERLRISRELHDSTAQDIIAILQRLESFCKTDEHLPMARLRSLWNLYGQIKGLLEDVRQLSRDLRPSILDDLGLLPAVEWLVEQLKSEHRIESSLIVSGAEKRFSTEVETTLFRIIQEALRNIIKHAEATKASVRIDFADSETRILISDNGKGFELPASLGELSRLGKLGLDGMLTRARLAGGSFDLKSSLGAGTTIDISIPV
ncbi:MAG: PAS domain S-box protein [Firmicutes bacterium]|nr:PAS domain S-box protein [Bacillota bacterium]